MIIKNGLLIDPKNKIEEVKDIKIEGIKVVKIADSIDEGDELIIDAKGLWVMPGAIDLHVHLREPGFEHKETIASGAMAAAKGGVTTVCAMPNTKPVVDNKDIVEKIVEKAKEEACVNILQVGAITKGQQGNELADIKEMAEAGICAISEDGHTVMDSSKLRKAMEIAKELDLPVLSHCEDEDIADGCMNEGKVSKKLGLPGIPKEAEDIIASRDMQLAQLTDSKIHLCHVSTKGSGELIKFYKDRGVKVSAEVCPHHFTLTEDVIDGTNTFAKMNPPLREQFDVDYLKEAIRDGIIDAIATDHAPHHIDEKQQSFEKAPNGIIGLETLIPLTITELLKQGYLTKTTMVEKLSMNPAKILGLDKGHLSQGAIADITIIDPEETYIFKESDIASKSKNSPFIGKEVSGRIKYTIVDGKVVYQHQ